MNTRNRHFYLDQDRISSTVSQQAAAEARWLAGARISRFDVASVGERERRIRESAYLRAERRGFSPGAEIEDWLAAEREIDRRVRAID